MTLTGEEIGYHDAMHQVVKSLQRRQKVLHESLKDASPEEQSDIKSRLSEVAHLIQVIESLHR